VKGWAWDLEALSVLEQVSGRAASSDALSVGQGEVGVASGEDALSLLVSVLEVRALDSEAFSVVEEESSRAAWLGASQIGLEGESSRAANSLALLSIELEVLRAEGLEALSVLQFESEAAFLSNAGVVDELEIGRAASSYTLSVDGGEASWAVSNADVSVSGESDWAFLLSAGSVFEDEASGAFSLAFSVDKLGGGRAGDLGAGFGISNISFWALLEDAELSLGNESDWAAGSLAFSFDELEALSAVWDGEALVSFLDGSLRAVLVLALSVLEDIFSIALDFEALVVSEDASLLAWSSGALAILEGEVLRAWGSDALSSLKGEAFLASLDAHVLLEDESGGAGGLDALSVDQLVLSAVTLESGALLSLLLEMLRALSSLAFWSDGLEVLRAGDLDALSIDLGPFGRALAQDAFVSDGLVSLLALSEDAGVSNLFVSSGALHDLEAVSSLQNEVFRAALSLAESLGISFEASLAGLADTVSVHQDGSLFTASGEAFSVLEDWSGRAWLDDALSWDELWSWLALWSEAGSFLVQGPSLLAVSNAELSDEGVSSWAAGSDTGALDLLVVDVAWWGNALLVLQVPSIRASDSDAFAVLQSVEHWAWSAVAGVVLEGVSFRASLGGGGAGSGNSDLGDAETVLELESSWAWGDDALSVFEGEVGRAWGDDTFLSVEGWSIVTNDLEALSFSEELGGWASGSGALSRLQGEELWAWGSLALSVDEGKGWLASLEAVLSDQLVLLWAWNSLAGSVAQLEVLLAWSSNALSVLEAESFAANDLDAFLSDQFLVLSAAELEAFAVLLNGSGFTGGLQGSWALSVLEGESLWAWVGDAGTVGELESLLAGVLLALLGGGVVSEQLLVSAWDWHALSSNELESGSACNSLALEFVGLGVPLHDVLVVTDDLNTFSVLEELVGLALLDTLSVEELEALFAGEEDALVGGGVELVVGWALGDLALSDLVDGVSLGALLSDALSVDEGEVLLAWNLEAAVVDPFVSSWASSLDALAVLEAEAGFAALADSSDSGGASWAWLLLDDGDDGLDASVLLGVVLPSLGAGDLQALSFSELEALSAWHSGAWSLDELVVLWASDSDALSVGELEVLGALGEASVVVEVVSLRAWSSGADALDELVVFGAFDLDAFLSFNLGSGWALDLDALWSLLGPSLLALELGTSGSSDDESFLALEDTLGSLEGHLAWAGGSDAGTWLLWSGEVKRAELEALALDQLGSGRAADGLALAFHDFESFRAASVDASLVLLGVGLVGSAGDLEAGLSLEGLAIFTGDSDASVVSQLEVLLALDGLAWLSLLDLALSALADANVLSVLLEESESSRASSVNTLGTVPFESVDLVASLDAAGSLDGHSFRASDDFAVSIDLLVSNWALDLEALAAIGEDEALVALDSGALSVDELLVLSADDLVADVVSHDLVVGAGDSLAGAVDLDVSGNADLLNAWSVLVDESLSAGDGGGWWLEHAAVSDLLVWGSAVDLDSDWSLASSVRKSSEADWAGHGGFRLGAGRAWRVGDSGLGAAVSNWSPSGRALLDTLGVVQVSESFRALDGLSDGADFLFVLLDPSAWLPLAGAWGAGAWARWRAGAWSPSRWVAWLPAAWAAGAAWNRLSGPGRVRWAGVAASALEVLELSSAGVSQHAVNQALELWCKFMFWVVEVQVDQVLLASLLTVDWQ
jgi:hypothetical protein